MLTRRRVLGGFVLAAVLLGDRALAQPLEPLQGDWQQIFQLAWEVRSRGDRPRLVGQIRNVSVYGASQIQLLVERLGPGERPLAQQIEWLGTNINAGDSDFFDFAVPDRAATYRVRVFAFTRRFQC